MFVHKRNCSNLNSYGQFRKLGRIGKQTGLKNIATGTETLWESWEGKHNSTGTWDEIWIGSLLSAMVGKN